MGLRMVLGVGATLLLGGSLAGCATTIPRDAALDPKPEGTKLKAFGFWGPGGRVSVENRVDIEEGSSQIQTELWGDANYGYADASLHVDVRLMVLTLGGSGGYRYGWHTLTFEPDENGLDHGETELTRDLRITKDEEDDFYADHYPWGEARARLVLPMYWLFGMSTVAFRYEDQPDNSLSWEHATVYDGGHLWRWDATLFLRHRHYGFVGPALRLLNVPRGDERATEVQYGIAGGTTPGWSTAEHTIVFRILANFGNELMGIQLYRAPIQVIVGYQQEIEL